MPYSNIRSSSVDENSCEIDRNKFLEILDYGLYVFVVGGNGRELRVFSYDSTCREFSVRAVEGEDDSRLCTDFGLSAIKKIVKKKKSNTVDVVVEGSRNVVIGLSDERDCDILVAGLKLLIKV